MQIPLMHSRGLRVTQSPIDPSPALSLGLLALARRSAAHDVNNLLAVIQGNLQLLPACEPGQAHTLCAEIDLACERLALLSDSWLLADPDPPQSGQRSHVADALQQVATVLRETQEADIRIEAAPAGAVWVAAIASRRLRAVLYCALLSLLRSGSRSGVDIGMTGRPAACTVHLQMACDAQHQPLAVAPDRAYLDGNNQPQSLSVGLWDIAQCLERHGGGMRLTHGHGVFQVWLDLPPAAD